MCTISVPNLRPLEGGFPHTALQGPAPNRPLPPTPDDEDANRTLVMRRVSTISLILIIPLNIIIIGGPLPTSYHLLIRVFICIECTN